MTEEIFVSEVKESGILRRIVGGIVMALAFLGFGGLAISAIVIIIVTIVAELIFLWILTVYILTFAHGILVDPTLFATASIFTIPYNDVFEIGMRNFPLFCLTYIVMILIKLGKMSNERAKKCKWGAGR